VNRSLMIRGALSVFIVYQLIVIIVLPNPSSILAHQVSSYLTPYANMFSMNTTWQFFSPNPGVVRYLEYAITYQDKKGEVVSEVYQWPPRHRDLIWVENYQRRNYHGLRSTMAPEKLEKYLFPFLCRLHPKAETISLKASYNSVPSLERAQLEGSDLRDESSLRNFSIQEHICERDKS
jgi:hypothetical protein